MFCGARTRSGGRCRRYSLAGKRRCRLHGGCSTGPKSRAGQLRNVGAMQAGRTRKQAMYRALGLAWPGGRPRSRARTLALQRQAKILLGAAITQLEELLRDPAAMPRIDERLRRMT
jgi:hypothetical protein